MSGSGLSVTEPFRTGKSNLYNSDAYPLEQNFERPAVKPTLALQAMRVRNNASGQPGYRPRPADGSSAALACGADGAQSPQQPTTPMATEQYAKYDQHSRKAEWQTRTTRHSTPGLVSFGQQQNANGSTDQVPKFDLLKSRSSSSRSFNYQVPVEDNAGEQVRPIGTNRVLQPSSLRGSAFVSPFATPNPTTTAPSKNAWTAPSPSTSTSSTSGGPVAKPSAVRDPPNPTPSLPDYSSLASSLTSFPLSSRRPSLLRTSSANSNSAATTLWLHSHTLPNITSPGSSGAAAASGAPTKTAVAATAAASFSPQPPPSPAQQPQPQPHSLSSTVPIGFTSPVSPVPPSSPMISQSSLGIRRGHLPPPIVSSTAGMCPSPGSGASPAAASSPAAMSSNNNNFRARLLNFREVAPPTPPSASASAPLVKSAPWRCSTAKLPNDADPGASQHGHRSHAHHHNTPLPPQPAAQHPSPQGCEDDDARRFQSAPLPLPAPSGVGASHDGLVVNGGGGGGAPSLAVLPGRSFRRDAVPGSTSLEAQFKNTTVDEWIEGPGGGGGGGGGGTATTASSPAAAAATTVTSSSGAAIRRSFPQVALWDSASPAVGRGITGYRRAQSDWGAKLMFGDSDSGRTTVSSVEDTDAIDSGSRILLGADPFALRDLPYGNAPRRAATSISGGPVNRDQTGTSVARHLGTDEVQGYPHQHNTARHSVPGCVSRLRFFENTEVLDIQEEMDDEGASEDTDHNASSEDTDDDSGSSTAGTSATDSAGQEKAPAVAMELMMHLDQILDPMLDILDPGRLVARRCMQRLQNGTNGINRPRAVESWADSEAALKMAPNAAGRSDGGNTEDTAVAAGTDGCAATATTNTAPVLAALAGQVLKLPCVGLEKLSDPEKRQKVVQRLREAGSSKLSPSAFTNYRPAGSTARWQP
ncbi:hypothetical protein Vretifemale_18130 [Volvox reticuliferus]|uniref:Uncharacterized protein n=1 Tax=Volvox reticuliferus TaxID=1737510 RepID=A0A8J4FXW8_9CHLO|nr:hypothetical protein Vretifemale_18130 [Volvox reticuliferus]